MSYISSQVKINPRRATDGFPLQRLQLLCAVLEKRLKLSLWSRDVYLNVAGGLKISEPASDLAVAVTIVSSLVCMNIIPGIAFIGEIGLSGEIRCVKSIEIRIAEAVKMGFTTIIIPKIDKSKKSMKNKSPNYLEYINTKMKINNDNKNNNNTNNNNNDNDNEIDNNAIDQNKNLDLENKTKGQRDYDRNKINTNTNNNNDFIVKNKKRLENGVIECSTLFEVLTIALNVDSFENILDRVKKSSKKKKAELSLEKSGSNGSVYNKKNYDENDENDLNNENNDDSDDSNHSDDNGNRSIYDYESN